MWPFKKQNITSLVPTKVLPPKQYEVGKAIITIVGMDPNIPFHEKPFWTKVIIGAVYNPDWNYSSQIIVTARALVSRWQKSSAEIGMIAVSDCDWIPFHKIEKINIKYESYKTSEVLQYD